MSIHVGIIGGAGYTAGELLRLLLFHPDVELKFVHSQSQAGKPLHSTHQDLLGETDLLFTDALDFDGIDVLFLCVGHGAAATFLEAHPVPDSVKIIDLSQDFRLKREGNNYVYGLPELNREAIRTAQHVANPGCFATCIQLALLPLAAAGQLHDDVHINAVTGSTGAGQAPSATTHFSWRSNNVSVYKAFNHQHLGEIGQSLHQLQPDFAHKLHFIPVRGNFTRGILATAYTPFAGSLDEAKALYQDYYAPHPFVYLSDSNPALKQVVGTNKGIVYLEKHDDQLLIISMIDNLLKGASGQAVQNMNLMFGREEKAGLTLKALAF
ncbi:N-acetyl-gamma-glutamyl-phosphate reductase [Catalinimonas alkaloidigena]|uniref:N-acetyl-gamma-glutamyl-phosphate reductase n=1 Tax=Catalinimonas alkaloidigena TaxID=1075417 RepID=A0A1G9T5T6_9BACT|nr:N-acetyl-gamma-glutamyl-phosphate reductase [Catalinimonas alkaloidigena]SDM42997.1 N-acetyl-gamma-glutamyl-phosphate reductase [Catalinimonas alkaloidigena]